MPLDLTPLTTSRYASKLALQQRGKLEEVTGQVASQQRHDSYAGFAEEGTLQSLVALKSEIARNDGYRKSNDGALSKLQLMDNSMGRVQDVADELLQLVTQRANSASGENIPVEAITESLLGRMQTALNATYNGHYLFGGSKSDVVPVGDLTQSNLAGDLPTASYYQGDGSKATVRSSDAGDVVYGLNADSEGFRKLVGAAHLLMEGDAGGDMEKISKAMHMADEGTALLAGDRATLRGNMEALRDVNGSLEDAGTLLETNLDDIFDVDIVEAATRMSELEASVQASYTAWARLSRLRLSDFL